MVSTAILYLSMSLLIMSTFSLYHRGQGQIRVFGNYGKLQFNGYFFLTWLVLVFIAVFRPIGNGYGGADTIGYIRYFETIGIRDISFYANITRLRDFLEYRELLFVLVTFFIRQISSDYHLYFFILYGFIAYSFLRLLTSVMKHSYCKGFLIPIFLLINLFWYSFNILRGCLAVSWCALSMIAILNDKYFMAFIYVLIGSMFHLVGLVFLLPILFLVVDRKCDSWTSGRLFIIAILINLATFSVRMILRQFLGSTSRFMSYFSGKVQFSIFGYLPEIFIAVCAVFVFNSLKSNGYARKIMLMLSANLSLQFVAIGMGGWRISDFFVLPEMCFYWVLKDQYFRLVKTRNTKRILNLVLFVFLMSRVYQGINSLYESSAVFPYFGWYL